MVESALSGESFSRIYQRPDAPARDSQRFRRRLAAYFHDLWKKDHTTTDAIGEHLRLAYGISVPEKYGYAWEIFFEKGNLSDVLDAITGTFNSLKFRMQPAYAEHWRQFIVRAMEEEALAYRVDDNCVVHFHVDYQFERNQLATISGLGDSRYNAARQFYEDGITALKGANPRTLLAVRGVYDANENVFRAPRIMTILKSHATRDAGVPVFHG